jgi:hypothetical protein
MLLRRVRAAVVLAVIWAVVWAPFSVALFLVMLWQAADFSPLTWHDIKHIVMRGALVGCAWGLVSGVVFTTALAAAERGAAVERLAQRRVVGWGALSGAALPLIILGATLLTEELSRLRIGPVLVVLIGLGAAVGTLVAAGLMTLARRGAATV